MPSSTAVPLWADRELIVSSVAGSTAARAGDVAAFLSKALANAERSALRGPSSAQTYSARVEAGIRRAVGALPANRKALGRWNLTKQVMDWIADQGPEFFNLRRMPDIEKVRSVIAAMEREKMRLATSQSVAGDA